MKTLDDARLLVSDLTENCQEMQRKCDTLLAALEDAEFLLRKIGQLSGPMQDSCRRSASDARAAIAEARKGAT